MASDTIGVINWSTAVERLKEGAVVVRGYIEDREVIETLNRLNKAHVPVAAQDEIEWFIGMLDGMSKAITNNTEDVPDIPVPAARAT